MLLVKIDGQEIQYNQGSLMASEASMIQRYAGRTIGEWAKGIEDSDVDCIAPLVWLIRKRNGEAIKFENFGKSAEEGGWDFDLGTFDIVDLDAPKTEEEAEGEDPTSPSSSETAAD